MYLRVPDAAGLRLPAGLPVRRPRARQRDRRGDRAARPPDRGRARRRRRAACRCPSSRRSGASGCRLLVVIYDDAAYGAEVHHFAPMGEAVDLAQFPDTDFAALAAAAGCHGVTARSLDDLAAVREWLAAPDRPARARRQGRSRRSAPNGSRRRSDTDRGGRTACPCSPTSSTPCSRAPPASSTSPSRSASARRCSCCPSRSPTRRG